MATVKEFYNFIDEQFPNIYEDSHIWIQKFAIIHELYGVKEEDIVVFEVTVLDNSWNENPPEVEVDIKTDIKGLSTFGSIYDHNDEKLASKFINKWMNR